MTPNMDKARDKANTAIAKNTIFLTFRMLLVMCVSLYTSRVILDKLGVNDFGIYQTVGGIVLMFSFINGALSNGASRFLSFELGVGNKQQIKKTFSTVFVANFIVAVFVCLIVEPIGFYIISEKLQISTDRLDVAFISFHISVVTCFLQIMLIPFTATIISHEKMGIYAYMGIVDVSLKLLICYLLIISPIDKLVFYSLLLLSSQFVVLLIFAIYSFLSFSEVSFNFDFDVIVLKRVGKYSMWSLLGSASSVLNNYGVNIVLGMFFLPSVVAARSLSNIANLAVNQFIANIRTAVNPQIVKKFAKNDLSGSKTLLLESTKYTFFIILLLVMPLIFVSNELLNIWLKEVPQYTQSFFVISIVCSLFQVFDTSFYSALYANGRIRENALTGPIIALSAVPITYVLFQLGYSPICLAWVLLGTYAVLGVIQKPILLVKIADYKYSEIYSVIFICLKVFLISVILPMILYIYKDHLIDDYFIRFVLQILIIILSISVTVWYFGLSNKDRTFVLSKIEKICNKKNM